MERLNERSLITIVEAAELLRLRPSTIRKWLHQRRLPKIKLGRRVLLWRGDCEALVLRSIVPRREDASK